VLNLSSDRPLVEIYQLALASSQILGELNFEIIFKLQSRKQNEQTFAKLTEIFLLYKRLIKNELAEYSFNSKFSSCLSNFLQKLWTMLSKQQGGTGPLLNLTSIFTYEILSNFYFETCCLFSHLVYNPHLLVINCASQTKILLDIIESFVFTYTPITNSTLNAVDSDACQLIVVRLRFLNSILQNDELHSICHRNMVNFESKIVCFIIFAYLTSDSKEIINEISTKNATNSHVDRELQSLVKSSIDKVEVFANLEIVFNSNLEEFLTNFVKKISVKIKNIQVIVEYLVVF
jgi:hypothetical protein